MTLVDIAEKPIVKRRAKAVGKLKLKESTIERIREGTVPKGDVIGAAELAALSGVKGTPLLVPHTHPILIEGVKSSWEILEDKVIEFKVEVITTGKTGVEIEAIAGVQNALLCIFDMVKSLEKDEKGQYTDTEISGIKVLLKEKGVES